MLHLFPDLADIEYLIGSDVDQVWRSSALFLLKLKEHRRVSQVAVNDVVEGCKALYSQTVSRVQAGVRARLAESGVDPKSIEGLDDVFVDVIDPFDGLETCHLQEKYFREKLGLIVSYFTNYTHNKVYVLAILAASLSFILYACMKTCSSIT